LTRKLSRSIAWKRNFGVEQASPGQLILAAFMSEGLGSSRNSKPLRAGSISLDPVRHEISVAGKEIHLTSMEFKLLQTLIERRGQVQERDRLLNDVWGYENAIDTRTVDTHVRRLRDKLGKAGDHIETIRGFGYRLSEK
jgi:DNA-binding response OmpR family regulator